MPVARLSFVAAFAALTSSACTGALGVTALEAPSADAERDPELRELRILPATLARGEEVVVGFRSDQVLDTANIVVTIGALTLAPDLEGEALSFTFKGDTSALDDGVHTVSVAATNLYDRTATLSAPLVVDGTAPVAAVLSIGGGLRDLRHHRRRLQ